MARPLLKKELCLRYDFPFRIFMPIRFGFAR